MEGIMPRVRQCAKERLLANMRSCRDAKLKTRYLIVVNLLAGHSAIAEKRTADLTTKIESQAAEIESLKVAHKCAGDALADQLGHPVKPPTFAAFFSSVIRATVT